MPQNNDAIAVMLLCCRMSATRQELFDPLSPQEYHALKQTLTKKLQKTPGWLIGRDIGELMQTVGVTEQEAHRLVVLMDRMVSLSYELDSYSRNGIELITITDRRYPASLSRRLGPSAPPVLYVCGNVNLFREPVLAFAGSIPADDRSAAEARLLADRTAQANMVLATSATSGLDSIAREQILLNGGRLIEWVPGGLTEAVRSESAQKLLQEGRCVLCSIVHPDSPIQSQNARSRSKCLYASGVVSYVAGCEYKRGDTWEGAAEALRGHYTERMLVRDTDAYSGNEMLIKRGAAGVSGVEELNFSLIRARYDQDEGEQLSVFDDRHILF